MAEIKSSGSSAVTVSSDTVADVYGPWTALEMGPDQASHPISFDSTWALMMVGDRGITISQLVGVRMDIQIGVGPSSPPATIVWGPMRYAFQHTGGGRGNSANFSFPLVASAGDMFWIRVKKAASTAAAGVQDIIVTLTTTDGIQPIRPATESFDTAGFFTTGFIGPVGAGTPDAPDGGGILFGDGVLSLWHLITPPGGLPLNSSWLSVTMNLTGVATSLLRWQMGAAPAGDPNPPDLPELIDVGFACSGGGGSHVQNVGDVYNFPVPWEKGENVWVRGAVIEPATTRSAKMAMNFWGNP